MPPPSPGSHHPSERVHQPKQITAANPSLATTLSAPPPQPEPMPSQAIATDLAAPRHARRAWARRTASLSPQPRCPVDPLLPRSSTLDRGLALVGVFRGALGMVLGPGTVGFAGTL